MRIRTEQLAAQLNKGLAPLYCVHGDETLLVLEASDTIRHHAAAAGYTLREIHHAEGHFNWNALLANGQMGSLFGDKRFVDLRIPSGKPGTEGAKAIQAYCANPPDETITLISLPKPDRGTASAKWFTALEQHCITVAIHPVGIEQLSGWINDRLLQQGQHTDTQALQLITEKVEGNLLAAQQEIRKLALLYPPGRLSGEAVRDAVLDVARYDVFKLADALLTGDAPRLVRILHGLKNEGQAPTLLLWSIARELRLLRQLVDIPHQRLKARMRELGVWDSRQPITERAASQLKPVQLDAALHQTAAIDRMIKGLDPSDPWLALEQLALSVC